MKQEKSDSEEQYVFMLTSSGDRTNIMANFKVVGKEDLISYIKDKSNKDSWRSKLRYAKVGGYCYLLNQMSLKQFIECFSQTHPFTHEEVTKYFRKEVSEVYGQHALQAKLKPLSTKSLVRGGVYKTASGEYQIYLGKVRSEEVKLSNGRDAWHKAEEPVEGIGWSSPSVSDIVNREFYGDIKIQQVFNYISILKSNRKVTEFTGIYLDLPDTYSIDYDNRYMGVFRKTWKLL